MSTIDERWNIVDTTRAFCQKVLPLVYDESLSYMELVCKLSSKLNEVIENNNNLPQYVKDLIKETVNSDDFTQIVGSVLMNTIINVKFPPEGITPAKGDGVTDDTASIQACLDYANNQGGAVVFLPSGKYLTGTLSLNTETSILGADRYNTILVLKGGGNTPLLQGAINQSIRNICLDGNRLNQTEENYLIVGVIKNALLSNLILTNSAHSVLSTETNNSEFNNIMITDIFDNVALSLTGNNNELKNINTELKVNLKGKHNNYLSYSPYVMLSEYGAKAGEDCTEILKEVVQYAKENNFYYIGIDVPCVLSQTIYIDFNVCIDLMGNIIQNKIENQYESQTGLFNLSGTNSTIKNGKIEGSSPMYWNQEISNMRFNSAIIANQNGKENAYLNVYNLTITNVWGEGVKVNDATNVCIKDVTMVNVGGKYHLNNEHDSFGDCIYIDPWTNDCNVVISNCYLECAHSGNIFSRAGLVFEYGKNPLANIYAVISNITILNANRCFHFESLNSAQVSVDNCNLFGDVIFFATYNNNYPNIICTNTTIKTAFGDYSGTKGLFREANAKFVNCEIESNNDLAFGSEKLTRFLYCNITVANGIGGTNCIFELLNSNFTMKTNTQYNTLLKLINSYADLNSVPYKLFIENSELKNISNNSPIQYCDTNSKSNLRPNMALGQNLKTALFPPSLAYTVPNPTGYTDEPYVTDGNTLNIEDLTSSIDNVAFTLLVKGFDAKDTNTNLFNSYTVNVTKIAGTLTVSELKPYLSTPIIGLYPIELSGNILTGTSYTKYIIYRIMPYNFG